MVPTARGGAGVLVDTPHSHGNPVPVLKTGSPAERFTSLDPADFAVPTGREEEWRFTPLRTLRPLFQPFESADSVSAESSLPDGVTLIGADRSHPLFGSALVPADRVSALAAAGASRIGVLSIPAEQSITAPVTLRAVGSPGLSYGHLIVEAGAFSSSVVVLENTGSATAAANLEIVVGEGAKLTVVSVHDGDPTSTLVASHGTLVERDGTLRHISINLGGKLVRITPTVKFGGPGATAELYGLSFATSGQHLESRLYIDHSVPHCTSNVVYKSVAQGDKAHTVWIGDVRIRPEAVGTTTYELNRNLLLTDGARADSVPNLEIETGEIAGAGHASATGRFDELQLFYLQSRGIEAAAARRLVVRGFFNEVLLQIPVQQLRDRLSTVIDARLDEVSL